MVTLLIKWHNDIQFQDLSYFKIIKMPGRTISIFNTAGGVGKSTLTQNLGYHLYQLKKKVLLIDLDTNATLTIFCGVEDTQNLATVYDCLMSSKALQPTKLEYFDLACTDINLVGAEVALVERAILNQRNYRLYLQTIINPIAHNYDYILIDCPASFGVLAVNALACSDHILIPFATYFKAYAALENLFTVFDIVRQSINPQLGILGIVPSKYEGRTKQCRRSLDAMHLSLGESGIKIFDPIRKSVAFSDASEKALPLAKYAANHPQVKNLQKIAQAIVDAV